MKNFKVTFKVSDSIFSNVMYWANTGKEEDAAVRETAERHAKRYNYTVLAVEEITDAEVSRNVARGMSYKPIDEQAEREHDASYDEYKPADYEFINVDGQPAVKIAGAVYNLRKSAYAVNLSPVIVSDHMTGKMLGIPSTSTSVLKNPICQERRKVAGSICEKCFAANVLTRYSDCEKNAASNFELLNSCVLPFELLPKFGNVCIARIESFGDVASVIQAINYANMAYNNPLVTFGWWTKNVEIVARAFDIVGKPDNVIFIQSSRFVNKPEEKRSEYVDKVFTVYDDEYLKNVAEIADTYNIILSKYAGKLSKSKECKAAIAALFEYKFINCGGRDCVSCRSCYSHNDVVDVRERLK